MTLVQNQIRETLIGPLIYVDTLRNDVNSRKENFIYGSPGFQKNAFVDTIIIDSRGTYFKIKKVTPVGRIKFWLSIKYFCKIIEYMPEIENNIKTISLIDLKRLIIQILNKNPSHWSAIGSVKNITYRIENCNTYKEISSIFNLEIK